MDPALSQAVSTIAYAIIGAVVAIIAFGIRKSVPLVQLYLEQKIGSEQLKFAKEFASSIVRSLQQSPAYEQLDPAKKKEMALLWLQDWCAKHNIVIEASVIDKIIEEQVQIMKSELFPGEDLTVLDIGEG